MSKQAKKRVFQAAVAGVALALFLLSSTLPGIDLPSIPKPDLGLPDIGLPSFPDLPEWLATTLRIGKFVVLAAIALLVVIGELQKRDDKPGEPS